MKCSSPETSTQRRSCCGHNCVSRVSSNSAQSRSASPLNPLVLQDEFTAPDGAGLKVSTATLFGIAFIVAEICAKPSSTPDSIGSPTVD